MRRLSELRRERKRIEHKRYYARTAFKYPARAWSATEGELVLAHAVPDRELHESSSAR